MKPGRGELWTGPPRIYRADGSLKHDAAETCESCGHRVELWTGPSGRAWLDDEPGLYLAAENPEQDDDELDWPEHTPERCRELRGAA